MAERRAPAVPARPPHVLRPMTPADEPLVLSSWLEGAREVAPYDASPRSRYYAEMRPAVLGRLHGAGAQTLVLAHEAAPEQVIAWVCFGPSVGGVPVVHWLYVYGMWRRLGFGAEALRVAGWHGGPVVGTGWSKHCAWIRRRVRLAYDPWVGGATAVGSAARRT